jgi:glycosyltransferase involved in cell wall biosynthesis
MISLISPSRNNLKYLKWSYTSVRKNAPASVEYCVADDFSDDGTWEWCQEMMKVDPNFKAIRNEGPTRLGHTILYDTLINEVATQPIVGIWHADMYMTPRTVEKIVDTVKPQVVVSLTRIEPPLHPPGPEKVVMDFKTEPEDFNEESFLQWYENDYQPSVEHKTTEGIFAPWFLLKQDFQSVGGHDPLYAPQSKEDSDIFNRFLLNGYSFVQVWDAAIYHMTCRGSRFNPTLTTPGKNSQEWETQNMISTRNFIRKWGHFVKHDQYLMPQVPPKFNVAFEVKNCDFQYIIALEPWCDLLCVGADKKEDVEKYIETEQGRAKSFDLSKRVIYTDERPHTDVTVHFDTKDLTQERFQLLTQLPEILAQNEETGTFELDIFKVEVNKVQTYEHQLINIKTQYN